MIARMIAEKQSRLAMIEKCADIIRKNLNMEIPFSENIDEAIKMLGGKIEEGKIENNENSELVLQTKPHEEIFIIRIRPKATKESRNFLIAFELGHLFLHTNYPEYLKNMSDENIMLTFEMSRYDDWYLFDAIHFAMNLIMPRMEFSYKVEEYTKDGKVDIKKLAQYFESSLNSVVIWGEELEEFY